MRQGDIMARKRFLRCKWRTYSKLGRGRKKIQKYRKAKGRSNKIRENNRGNPVPVVIGYKKHKKESGIKTIYNLNDLALLNTGDKVILSKVGQKKKLAIIEKAKEKDIKIINVNIKRLMAKIEKKNKDKKTEKDKRIEKEKTKKEAEKKAEEKKKEETKENKEETKENPENKK
jgi:ribosomal protein L32E